MPGVVSAAHSSGMALAWLAPVYPGVPTLDLGTLSLSFLEYPKSQIFSSGRLLPSSSVFSSFISRFTTPCTRRG